MAKSTAESEEPEDETVEEEVKEKRKLYLGTVKKVKEIEVERPTPVQPVIRQFTTSAGWAQTVPPSFILTRFSPGYTPNSRLMHYWSPKTRTSAQIDIPEEFELNVLSGRQGKEMAATWDDKVKSDLGSMARRLGCTIGTDPEIFVVDKRGVVPAWTFLGSKAAPNHYTYQGETTGDIYWDGFQAEFTTPGFLTCLVELGHAIHRALKVIDKKAPTGSSLSIQSVVPVDPEVLAGAKEEHVQFGCAPSQNLYGLRGNSEPGRNVPYRFAGGHIHMGLADHDKKRIPDIVRALDAVLAVACVSLFASLDSAVRRRFYGQAGEYRTPSHGLEYRVLSNAWLTHPAIYHITFDLARSVAGLVTSGFDLPALWKGTQDDTIRAIQECDVDLARRILSENEAVFRQLMVMAGTTYKGPAGDVAWRTWTQGVESLVKDPKKVASNWKLDGTWDEWLGSCTFYYAATAGRKV